MKLGARETMSIKTRLDGRSEDNNLVHIKNLNGEVVAEIKLLDMSSANLSITTVHDLTLSKPSGWTSK